MFETVFVMITMLEDAKKVFPIRKRANVKVYYPMPKAQAPTVVVPPPVEGPITDLIIKRNLKKALNVSTNLTPEQKQMAKKILANDTLFDFTVWKVQKDLSTQMTKSQMTRLGDGAWLRILIENLPAIIDAILKLIG